MSRGSICAAMVAVAVAGCGHGQTAANSNGLPHADEGTVAAGAHETPLIAVVDGGVDASHPSLRGRVLGSWSATGLSDAPSAHATQVAGLIAGRPGEGFSGGTSAARILDAKALDERGNGRPADIASALRWAVEHDAELIVTSFGTEQDHAEVRTAVADAIAAGVTIVAATGNGLGDFDFYPAGYPGVMGITSHDRDGRPAAFANVRGADFASLGEDVVAPTVGGGYTTVSGTSIAAATATGLLAACWRSAVPLEHTPDGAGRRTDDQPQAPSGEIPSLSCPRH